MSSLATRLKERAETAQAGFEAKQQQCMEDAKNYAVHSDYPKLLGHITAAADNARLSTEYNLAYGNEFSDYDCKRAETLVMLLVNDGLQAKYKIRGNGDHGNILTIYASWEAPTAPIMEKV